MPSLTTCIKKAGSALAPANKATVLAKAKELRDGGMDTHQAALSAVQSMLDLVNERIEQLQNPPPPPPESEAVRKAKADLQAALGDLGDILGRGTRLNMLPEQEQKLLPVLTKLMDAAFRLGYLKFKEASRFVLDQIRSALGSEVADQITLEQLQGAYIGMSGRYKDEGASSKIEVVSVDSLAEIEADRPAVDNPPPEAPDVPSTSTNLERDRQDPADGDAPVVGPVSGDGPADGAGAADAPAGGGRGGRSNRARVPSRGPAAAREPGDQQVPGADRADGPTEFDAGADDAERSDDPGLDGVPLETIPDEAADAAAEPGLDDARKRREQREADGVAIIDGDLANIRQTLPYLLEGQQEDVLKTEQRFAKPDGYGMLFTNGTGTGKTFTGLGVVKRFARRGKTNTLIVVPDDKILADWVDSAKALGLSITQLQDTKDAGTGIVITTYANVGANDAVAGREWDLVVTDEAHMLMQGMQGESTSALDAVRALTYNPRGEYGRYVMLNRADIDLRSDLGNRITANEKLRNKDDTMDVMRDSLAAENIKLQAQWDKVHARLEAERKKNQARFEAAQGAGRTRLLALSATPFAYAETVDWAEGYLFEYGPEPASRGYNTPSAQQQFMIDHFGYRMRTGKLNKPDAKVDSGLMERQFNSWLKKSGALSARMLDVKADYDRRFVLAESAVGNAIDEAMEFLRTKSTEHREAKKDGPDGYEILSSQINGELYGPLGYLVRRYLLEAIKAKEVIPIIRQHLALGRKVVVFHDFNKGGSKNPFDVYEEEVLPASAMASDMTPAKYEEYVANTQAYNAAVRDFREQFPMLVDGKTLASLISPIQRFVQEFPDVLLINGLQKKKDLLQRYKRFNDDNQGPIVALVQSDKNKGWSGHDTTGKYQRVLFNLGLPTQPTKSIQQEGRIYRTGQVSDAIFRYLNTGTNWERYAFAETIAKRSGTAENLGMGELARALKDAFISAFEESDAYPPGHEGEGKGGKERDRLANQALSEYDRAKSFYWGTQKKNARTKAQEGADYFATPEPVGLKMIEWADVRPGEDFLEPSGGHGAIARWAGEKANRTAIEPSAALASRLALVFDGKIIQGRFEDLDIVNKYDTVAMNPPFGTAGRTAVDHVAKAARHVREGGRIVALIPEGSATEKFDKWFYEEETRPAKPLMQTKAGPVYVGDQIVGGLEWQSGRVTGKTDSGSLRVKTNSPGETLVNPDYVKEVKATGKRTETFKPAEGWYMTAEIRLPSVTFERAGTGVRTRIVVLDKPGKDVQPLSQRKIDLSDITDINVLFDRLEDIELPKRQKVELPDIVEIAKKGPVAIEELQELADATTGNTRAYMDQAITAFRESDFMSAADNVEYAVRSWDYQVFRTQAAKLPARLRSMRKQQIADTVRQRQEAQEQGAGQAQAASLPVVEHVTAKGKTLRGVIVTHLTKDQAKEIDEYTWAKNGGFFIRLEHLAKLMAKYPPPGTPEPPKFSRPAAATDTPEFRKWFGDSKATTQRGEPLVVYHGAPDVRFVKEDGTFKTLNERYGYRGSKEDPARAFFFTDSRRTAETYADDRRAFDYQNAEPGVVDAYLSIQNPLVIDAKGKHWRDAQKSSKGDVIAQAKAAGNDGVIIRNVYDDYNRTKASRPVDVYIAFASQQIKSATGNRGTFDPANPDIRFDRQAGFGTGSASTEAIRAALEPMLNSWVNRPDVVVADSPQSAGVPDVIRREDARQRRNGARPASGVYWNGTVYLFSEGLRSPQHAITTLHHEVLGHFGFRGAFADQLRPMLANMVRLNRPAVMAKAEAYGLDIDNPTDALIAAEEVLAELAETRPSSSWVQRALAIIKDWLRRNLPAVFDGGPLSDAELIEQFIMPARRWVERGLAAREPDAAPVFEREGGDNRQPNTRAEIRAARAAIRRIEEAGGVTSLNDLAAIQRVSGYSQWAESAVLRDVDATRRLHAELAERFPLGDWKAPRLNMQGVIAFAGDWVAGLASPQDLIDLAAIADRYSAPAMMRGNLSADIGRAADEFKRLLEPAGFERYRGLQERGGRTPDSMIRYIRPAGGVTAVTPLFQRVWHGTPYRGIEKFDTKAIGTGEGQQAYGWGLYFASRREIAEHYRKTLAGVDFDYADDATRDRMRLLTNFDDWVWRYLGDTTSSNEFDPERTAQAIEAYTERYSGSRDALREIAGFIRSGKLKPKPAGQLYEVEVPEDSDMLLWDAPLSEQPANVKAALAGTEYEIGPSEREVEALADRMIDADAADWADENDGDPVDFSNNANRDDYIKRAREQMGGLDSSLKGRNLYWQLMRDAGHRPQLDDREDYQRDASQTLLELGIKGIKYLDGNSRAAGAGSYNYVIFDGADVTDITPMFSRRGWAPGFPDAVLGHRPGVVEAHADYAAAKAGDDRAALRLARDVVGDDYAQAVKQQLPNGSPVIVLPVLALEAAGKNRIPLAAAQVLASKIGATADTGIVQAERVGRTGSDGMRRLAVQPTFTGPVQPGGVYLLLDDTLAQGGTLTQLKTYIEDNGGTVALVSALTGKAYSAKLAISNDQLQQLRDRFGAIEPWWRSEFGYGFEGFTESEARFLLKLRGDPSPDDIRNRVAAARVSGVSGVDGQDDRDRGNRPPVEPPLFSRRSPARDRVTEEAMRRAGVGNPATLRDKIRRGFGRAMELVTDRNELAQQFRQGALDQFYGIRRAVTRDIGALPHDQDPYVSARLANGGASSVMRALMLHGQARWAANGQHLEKIPDTKGLLEILEPLGDEVNEFFGWMIGNRADRLKREGRENNLSQEHIEALKALGTAERLPKFQTAAREYAAFKRSVLDVAQQAGLIDPVARRAWDHADYIPFYRQIDERAVFAATGRKGLSKQSSGIRMLRGGTAELNDPMENLLMNFSRLIDASLKNRALSKTIRALEDAGSEAVQKTGLDVTAAFIPTGQVRKLLVEAGTPEEVLDAIPEEVFEGIAKMWAVQAPSDPDIVRVMRGGKATYYRVNDPLLLQAMTSFVPFDFPGLAAMRAAKRLLTATVTATPEFMLRNWVRDSVAAQAITPASFNPAKSITGVVKSFNETGAYEAMLFAGASFQSGNVNAGDPQATAVAMRRALRRKGMNAASIDGFMATLIDSPARFWEKYREIGEAIENANREAVYEAAASAVEIRNGQAVDQRTTAAYEAKDLMDFSLRGSWAAYQLLADVLPFFNARVQGLYRLGRANPARLVTVGTMLTVASLLLAMANDGEEWYEKLPDWDKDTNWHFRIGEQHFRLPKPFELGVIFATIPERIGRSFKGLDDGDKTAARLWANIRDQLAFDPVPQLFRPVLNVWGNWDTFRDAPIESMRDEGKLPHLRYSAVTSDTTRVLADAIDPVADSLGLSPKRMEYLVGGYFGTAGLYALGLSDMLVRQLEGLPPGPSLRADDIPVVRAFYREDPARGTVFESDLYKMRTEVDAIYRSITGTMLDNPDKARELYTENQAKLQVRGAIVQAVQAINELGRQRDAIIRDPNMPPAEKRRLVDLLQEQRNELAQRVVQNQAVKEAF